ncbi:BglG family transcriptional antiterminator [Breznakia blatticola]|uniref:BglG family transcriptional antiterminator n=1 Tax=Breznakia blatticola TaxID=1754012 RepID=A0A4R8A8T9_9FIRM|nr:PTS sugar transporter subunit IIA [Breznakia blatticola]TDW26324.1 BglG family transcriptional antiterminator [Breznakia blatticola]
MNKKYVDVIELLYNKNTSVTSKEIANSLGISVRTVKNYVSAINLEHGESLIYSSNNGYQINRSSCAKYLEKDTSYIPQTSEERSFEIIKRILIEHCLQLNIYDLSEDLFVSYSTIKKDISRMNHTFSNFHVEFVIVNDAIQIIGKEKNKRKLVSYVLYEETNKNFMNAEIISNSFDTLPIERINHIIVSTFEKYNYYINDFSRVNLLLHFAIIIDRILSGHSMDVQNESFQIDDENERSLVNELCHTFENEFHISFETSERYEVYMLFKTNANYSLPTNDETLHKIIGLDILSLAKRIVEKINDYYFINLDNENFVTPFALHLKNLILRASNKQYTKNPMAESIKSSCPTVYDIAILMAVEIQNQFHVDINEDEIAFLALHVGAEIERQKVNDSKLKVILICPNYMKIAGQLYNDLLISFGNQIDIVKTINAEEELHKYSFDMCITVVKINAPIWQEVVLIPPFIKQPEKNDIYAAIHKVQIDKQNRILKNEFHRFFSKDLFLVDPEFKDKNELINIMSDALIELNYVPEDYTEKIFARENAASTIFGNIAIPHAMKMEAFKTCVYVCVSKKGIDWGTQKANVILLIAINKTDSRIFHELYEALIGLFSREEVVNLAKNCTTFEEFEKLIYEQINM